MLTRLALGVLLLAGTLATAAPRRVYAVRWGGLADGSPEQRALIAQVDRQLRDELRRRGAFVVDGQDREAIVLKPSLEVLPRGLRLSLVGVRGADQKLLGTISTKAAGANRDAQLKAIISRVCLEADQLE